MSVRAKASAVALATLACLLLAPAALASSGPAQFTGRQLKAALLPPSDFVAGYTSSLELDSGRHLEHGTTFSVRSMKCSNFWVTAGQVPGFGETAFAGDVVDDKTGTLNPEEVFDQSVYQFASTGAAASFYGQLVAKYRSCHSATASAGGGSTLRFTVRSQSTLRVGGHQALQIIGHETLSGTPSQTIYLLWTIDGTDVYRMTTLPLASGSPQPTQSSLTLKLIARVSALR